MARNNLVNNLKKEIKLIGVSVERKLIAGLFNNKILKKNMTTLTEGLNGKSGLAGELRGFWFTGSTATASASSGKTRF